MAAPYGAAVAGSFAALPDGCEAVDFAVPQAVQAELTCEHENGAVSRASLSGSVRLPAARTRVELFGPAGELVYDTAGLDHEECRPVLRREFAAAVRAGRSGALGARRGLRPQGLPHRALAG